MKWLIVAIVGIGVVVAALIGRGYFRKAANTTRVVYELDFDAARDTKLADIAHELERLAVTAKTTRDGALVVTVEPGRRATVEAEVRSAYAQTLEPRACSATDGPSAICFQISPQYFARIKQLALDRAVAMIRTRIGDDGVSVASRGDNIVVDLPTDPSIVAELKELIARTARLEIKVVDDCTDPPPAGCVAGGAHDGSVFMQRLTARAKADAGEVTAEIDHWAGHTDDYLLAHDASAEVPIAWARAHGCAAPRTTNATVRCIVTGRDRIDDYVRGLGDRDPTYRVPDDHQLAFGQIGDRTWRSYYLERAPRVTGSSITNATGSFDPDTRRPIVVIDLDPDSARAFEQLSQRIAGMKLATLVDGNVKSAPVIATVVRGGRISITMGDGDVNQMERERDDLVAVLRTGSLPAPLREVTP